MGHIFYLRRENDIFSAKVTAINHPYHHLYHVQFEDGYENIFFTDVETGDWVEEDLGVTSLAGNFGRKICLFNSPSRLACKTLSWCKASIADKVISFGFYTYMEDTETVFEVYGDNHKFLYSFRNSSSNTWEVYGPHYFLHEDQYTEQVKIIISLFNGLADGI
jgi:hypothetical protein